MEKSRTKNAKLNIIYGYIAQIGIIILSFVGRKIFLNFLSAEYLGINGLYSNILIILSLGELGLDMAAMFSLYKPVAEKNIPLVHALVNFYRKIYAVLSIVILIIGLALIPFLSFLINSELPYTDLIIYYLLFLFNSIVSYFVAHKVVLLSACQEQRIQKLVMLTSNLILQILHIIVLIIFKNYYIYIFANIVSTLISNIILSVICSKKHRDVFENHEKVYFEKKPIIKRIVSAFLYKFGAVLVTSTDNILISALVSTIAVGYYSNYYQVVTAIQGFIAIVTTSLIAGIGNLTVKGTKKAQLELFDMLVLFYHTIAALGLIGFTLLFNNLISIWLGSEYLFDEKTVFMIALVFYFTNAISPIWMFREANGEFDKAKYVLLVRAVINILLSIIFGLMWGTFGIFLATVVSLLLTNFWIEPKILFNSVLERKENVYWFKQLKYFLITIISFVACYYATKNLGNSLWMLFIKTGIVCIITITLFLIFNFKSNEAKKMKSYILKKNKKMNNEGDIN